MLVSFMSLVHRHYNLFLMCFCCALIKTVFVEHVSLFVFCLHLGIKRTYYEMIGVYGDDISKTNVSKYPAHSTEPTSIAWKRLMQIEDHL